MACLFAGKAMFPPSAPGISSPNLTTVSAVAEKQPASVRIEDIRVGQRVISQSVAGPRETQVDPRTWRMLRLRAENRWADGTDDPVELEVLQPREWIEQTGARVAPGCRCPCLWGK